MHPFLRSVSGPVCAKFCGIMTHEMFVKEFKTLPYLYNEIMLWFVFI